MSRCVDLDEKVTAQFYDQEFEEWTMQTVTIEDVLDSVCNEYTVLPSAQPTDADIQKMQDIEQAMLGKAYECGKQDAVQWIPCSERLPNKADHTDDMVLVCYRNGSVRFNTYMNGWAQGNPVAWMPLPEPYKEDDDETD